MHASSVQIWALAGHVLSAMFALDKYQGCTLKNEFMILSDLMSRCKLTAALSEYYIFVRNDNRLYAQCGSRPTTRLLFTERDLNPRLRRKLTFKDLLYRDYNIWDLLQG